MMSVLFQLTFDFSRKITGCTCIACIVRFLYVDNTLSSPLSSMDVLLGTGAAFLF